MFFWKQCPDQVGSALVASLMFKSLASKAKSAGKLHLAEELDENAGSVVVSSHQPPPWSKAPTWLAPSQLSAGPSTGGRRESFPGPRDVWGGASSLKNTQKGVPDGFFLTSDRHKTHFRPAGGAYNALQIPSRMVRGHPSPCSLPIEAFVVSISAPIRNELVIEPRANVFRAPLWLLTGLAFCINLLSAIMSRESVTKCNTHTLSVRLKMQDLENTGPAWKMTDQVAGLETQRYTQMFLSSKVLTKYTTDEVI